MNKIIKDPVVKRSLYVCLLIMLCLAPSGHSVAQEEDVQNEELVQYRVEYLIVRHLNPATGTEIWPPHIVEETEEDVMTAQRFANVPPEELEFGDMVKRLANSKNFRVLVHAGWIQPGFAPEDARRNEIRRIASTGEIVYGHFLLGRQRYLRLEIDLTLDVDGESYWLQTSRRMLSRKTHYFDHPHLGVIVRITPVE